MVRAGRCKLLIPTWVIPAWVLSVTLGCSSGSGTTGTPSALGGASSSAADGATTAVDASANRDGATATGSAGTSSSGSHMSAGPGGSTNAGSGGGANSSSGVTDAGSGGTKANGTATADGGDAGSLQNGAPNGGIDATVTVPTVGKLFWLAIIGNEVLSANETGANAAPLVSGQGISAPDGIGVDVAGGKMYWTNMGTLTDSPHTPAGSLQRANLDGSGVEVLLQPGATTNTPKQLQLDLAHGKIYWSDREGAEAWRANLDGSNAEVLLSGHGIQQLVGMALDIPNEQFYVTDRYAKTILRASFDMPSGQDASTRSDVETLYTGQGSAMPIDLDLDLQNRMMYWTDRGVGTIERASMDLPSGQTASNRADVTALVSGLSEPIGISLDLPTGVMYFTELGGQILRVNLDGTGQTSLATSSGASGIAHVTVPM